MTEPLPPEACARAGDSDTLCQTTTHRRRNEMPEYVLNRKHNLRTVRGCISFEAGTPTWVPPHMVRDAVEIGALPVEGEAPDPLGDQVDEKVPLDPEQRIEQINSAFDQLVEENDPANFTGQGIPTVAAVRGLTGITNVDKSEVHDAWNVYRVVKGL
jgi:hypothetical protein